MKVFNPKESEKVTKTFKLSKLSAEICSFVLISSLKKLIRGKKALRDFEKALDADDTGIGNSDRTLADPSYIFYIVGKVSIPLHAKYNIRSFGKMMDELNKVDPDYIDLEN